MNKSVLIHQAVHGYRDGHRLLASSLDLPGSALQVLASVSDATDVDRESDFPSLLNGVHLPETGLYALTRTWPAVEMPRPGSVWSHSLLLPLEVLDFGDAGSVERYFEKPTERRLDSYEAPIEFKIGSRRHPQTVDRDTLATLIWAIFETPVRPVVFAADAEFDSAKCSELAYELLHRVPGYLTTELAFAEAPGYPRRTDRGLFDLQFVGSSSGSWVGELKQIRLVRPGGAGRAPDWVDVILGDRPESRAARSLAIRFGSQSSEPKHAFVVISSTLAILSERESGPVRIAQAVDNALSASGGPDELAEFKRWLLEPNQYEEDAPPLTEGDALWALARTAAGKNFETDKKVLNARAADLWSSYPESAIEILRIPPSRGLVYRHAISSGVLAGAIPEDALRAIAADEELVTKIVKRQPSVIARAELWEAKSEIPPPALSALRDLYESDKLNRKLVRLLVANLSDDHLKLVAECAPEISAQMLGALIADSSSRGKMRDSTLVLDPSSMTLEAWLQSKPNPDDVLRLASIIRPRAARKIPQLWLSLDRSDSGAALESASTRALELIFVSICGRGEPEALRTAARVFNEIWIRMIDEAGAEDDFNLLRDRLQAKSLKSLRRRMSDKIASRYVDISPAPSPAPLLLITDEAALRSVLDAVGQSASGATVISDLAAVAADHPDSTQESVIYEALVEYVPREDLLGLVRSLFRTVFGS